MTQQPDIHPVDALKVFGADISGAPAAGAGEGGSPVKHPPIVELVAGSAEITRCLDADPQAKLVMFRSDGSPVLFDSPRRPRTSPEPLRSAPGALAFCGVMLVLSVAAIFHTRRCERFRRDASL